MKILLAVDGSEYTTKAANYLITHFGWLKERPELHLLHVKAPIPAGRARAVMGHDAVESYYKEESEAALAPAEKLLRENAIPFKSGYRVGDIPEQIQAYVKEHDIDLIMMGSHGRGAFQNLIMGSVATHVLASTTVPVLLIR